MTSTLASPLRRPTQTPDAAAAAHPQPRLDRTPMRALADGLPTWGIALSAVALTALSGNRGGVSLLAWLAPVPLALAATRLRGWRGRSLLLALVASAFVLQTLKMVTAPIAPVVAAMFGVASGLLAFLWLWGWDLVQRRATPAWSLAAFAGFSAAADYVGFSLSPGGHWATSAASHADDLPLLQLASLGGLTLVGLAAALPAAALTAMLLAPEGRRPWRAAGAALLVVAVAYAWGTWRLDTASTGPTVRVGAVTVDFPEDLSSIEQLRGQEGLLFARSALAVQRGAQLVVWNELATLVDPAGEPALLEQGAAFAREHQVDLVMAYGRLDSREPPQLDNQYRWFGPDGAEVQRYRKHFIPLGEPSMQGTEPLEVVQRPWGTAAGAICYDYTSPALARQHARGGAGLVALPASDWRGIDPQHTLFSRVRAIEGGMSVVRSTRAATTMAFDAHGRVLASMSAWGDNERVMVAAVPTRQVPTLYAEAGDWPVLVAAGLILAALTHVARRRRASKVVGTGAAPAPLGGRGVPGQVIGAHPGGRTSWSARSASS